MVKLWNWLNINWHMFWFKRWLKPRVRKAYQLWRQGQPEFIPNRVQYGESADQQQQEKLEQCKRLAIEDFRLKRRELAGKHPTDEQLAMMVRGEHDKLLADLAADYGQKIEDARMDALRKYRRVLFDGTYEPMGVDDPPQRIYSPISTFETQLNPENMIIFTLVPKLDVEIKEDGDDN